METTLLDHLHNCLEQKPCPSPAPIGQAAVLMAITDEMEPELILIRRTLQLPTHPGEIALPGGKVEKGDIDLRATALREAWEEIGLPGEVFRYAGHLPSRFSANGLVVSAIVGVVPAQLTLRAQISEVDEILAVPLHFFAEPENLRGDRLIHNNVEHVAARFQYRHHTIWGMTAGFIVELVNRFYRIELRAAARSPRILAGVDK
ncbi:MAG: nudix hydroxylase [Verrucomicrobiaceae bacterium]|nr:nudix hydroxylase [Verrucomicrobiaceae bacterium]